MPQPDRTEYASRARVSGVVGVIFRRSSFAGLRVQVACVIGLAGLGLSAALEPVHVADELVVSDESARTDFHCRDRTRGHQFVERASSNPELIERVGDGVQQTRHGGRHVRLLPVSSKRIRSAIDRLALSGYFVTHGPATKRSQE